MTETKATLMIARTPAKRHAAAMGSSKARRGVMTVTKLKTTHATTSAR